MAKRKNKAATSAEPAFSRSESTELLLASILDPHNPKQCGMCLHGALLECTRAEKLSGQPSKKSEPPNSRAADIYTALVAFLLQERTDKQVDRLLECLSKCTCRISNQSAIHNYHDKGREHSVRTMARIHKEEPAPNSKITPERCAFIADLCYILLLVVKNSGIVSVAKGSSQSWPNHTADLLPFGSDNFIQSMMRWYRFIPDTVFFRLTGEVLRVCHTLLVPSLAKYRMSHVLVEATRKLVDVTMVDILSTDDEVRHRAGERFNYRATDFVIFLTTLLHQKIDNKAEFVRGCETKAMQLCSMILYLSSDPNMPPCGLQRSLIHTLAWHGHDLFRFFHMHLYPRPDMPVHPDIVKEDEAHWPPIPPPEQRQPITLSLIQRNRSEMRCSAYKCESSLQTSGKNFQRCGRCMVVSYCGRECQTKAWKDEKHPHKRVCPMLRSLIDRGGGHSVFFKEDPIGAMVVLQNWRNAGVTDDELNVIDDWDKMITDARGYPLPDGTEWTPGYEDYNEIIAQLSAKGRGPKARYLNRLARWPSEERKQRESLMELPFWLQEIDICLSIQTVKIVDL